MMALEPSGEVRETSEPEEKGGGRQTRCTFLF